MKNKSERYNKYSRYLKERFGEAVYKVSVDAGFSCPNIDGEKDIAGCIYCDNKAFSFNARLSARSLEAQIKEGQASGIKRYGANKFIVYFQAHTNTYAPVGLLKEKYSTVKKFKNIVGVSIGTRPDCIDEKKLDLIEDILKGYEVWIEYGLQSVHDDTLKSINRNHSYEDFLNAVKLTRKRNIKICAHVIVGLPGESGEDMLKTARELGRLRLEGVKIHPLYVVKGTKMEEYFKEGRYKTLSLDDFVEISTEFLRYLWPKTVIQRISADCPREFLLSPEWILDKGTLLKAIDKRLLDKDIFQGDLYSSI